MFPVILIGLNGHSLEISTALTLERIVVNELLNFDMKNDLNHETTIRKLTWIASVLKECASRLENIYQRLERKYLPHPQQASSSDTDECDRYRRFFPQPTPDPRSPPSEQLPGLTYLKRLNRDNKSFKIPNEPSAHRMRSLFTGTLALNLNQPKVTVSVVVKFTAKYNEGAHKLLAEEGLAPKLYACQRVIGNLFMVVMERHQEKPPTIIWH
jgi:hypothetical protein